MVLRQYDGTLNQPPHSYAPRHAHRQRCRATISAVHVAVRRAYADAIMAHTQRAMNAGIRSIASLRRRFTEKTSSRPTASRTAAKSACGTARYSLRRDRLPPPRRPAGLRLVSDFSRPPTITAIPAAPATCYACFSVSSSRFFPLASPIDACPRQDAVPMTPTHHIALCRETHDGVRTEASAARTSTRESDRKRRGPCVMRLLTREADADATHDARAPSPIPSSAHMSVAKTQRRAMSTLFATLADWRHLAPHRDIYHFADAMPRPLSPSNAMPEMPRRHAAARPLLIFAIIDASFFGCFSARRSPRRSPTFVAMRTIHLSRRDIVQAPTPPGKPANRRRPLFY